MDCAACLMPGAAAVAYNLDHDFASTASATFVSSLKMLYKHTHDYYGLLYNSTYSSYLGSHPDFRMNANAAMVATPVEALSATGSIQRQLAYPIYGRSAGSAYVKLSGTLQSKHDTKQWNDRTSSAPSLAWQTWAVCSCDLNLHRNCDEFVWVDTVIKCRCLENFYGYLSRCSRNRLCVWLQATA